MRWALVLVALVGCEQRLVDMSSKQLADLCTHYPLSTAKDYATCSSTPGAGCSFLRTSIDCVHLINSLPADCGATASDLEQCTHATCTDPTSSCSAFAECGIQGVWYVAHTSCG